MKTWHLAFGTTYSEGERLIYIGEHGWPHHQAHAKRFMEKGEIFTIKDCDVQSDCTYIEFTEIPDEHFNSVMFEKCILGVEIGNERGN